MKLKFLGKLFKTSFDMLFVIVNFEKIMFLSFLSRRVVELLTQNWSLSPKVRLPAISRLQVSVFTTFVILRQLSFF